MAVGHGPYQDVRAGTSRQVLNQGISGHDIGDIEHTDAVGAVRHRKERWAGQTFPCRIVPNSDRQRPVTRTLCVRAGRRLNAIRRTHPGGEADIMDAIWRCPFPGRRRHRRERPRRDLAIRPPRFRTITDPLIHEVRHEWRRDDRVRIGHVMAEIFGPLRDDQFCLTQILRRGTILISVHHDHAIPTQGASGARAKKLP